MRTLRALFASFILASATGALAGSPAMIAPADPAEASAERTFSSFAGDWMQRARARGAREAGAPRAKTGSAGLIFVYRTVADDFETELRPTGRPAAPYVGVLHYTEQTFACDDVAASRCRMTSTLPVSEVFRYRGGRWSY